MKVNSILLLAVVGLGIAVTAWLDSKNIEQTSYKKIPDIEFQLLDGSKTSLAQLSDKPIIIHFWATWCAPCVVEYPDLVKMATNKINDVNVITIAVQNNPKDILQFFKKNNINIPENVSIALDPNWQIAKNIFKTSRLPESFLLSRKQEIIKRHNGVVDNWDQSPWIKEFNRLQLDNFVDNK